MRRSQDKCWILSEVCVILFLITKFGKKFAMKTILAIRGLLGMLDVTSKFNVHIVLTNRHLILEAINFAFCLRYVKCCCMHEQFVAS